MRPGDTIRVAGETDLINPDLIEVRELESLSFEEARALVTMLGGSHSMPPVSPGAGMMPTRHQVTALQKLFASLPPRQRHAFLECMDRVWPPKSRFRPAGADTWDDAWAAALSAASKEKAGESG